MAEELNFARAAENLRIAPSPLSRAIRELEKELRAPLFDRGTRHVALTTAGVALVPKAQEILAQVAALRQVTSHSARTRAELTMGVRAVPDTLRRTLIDDVFHAVDADATVEIVARRTEDQYRALLRGEFDFGVTVGLPDDPRIDYHEMMTETYGIAVPDIEPYRSLEIIRPEDISELTMILPRSGTRTGRLRALLPVGRAEHLRHQRHRGGDARPRGRGQALLFRSAQPGRPVDPVGQRRRCRHPEADGPTVRDHVPDLAGEALWRGRSGRLHRAGDRTFRRTAAVVTHLPPYRATRAS
ncbi:LysR family transcriptional regulator [Mycolicibacterium smegmatis]|uniref:LysR family transcriptional regulator n=1 Tax=Mycolicibacterium smegmatis TaxID=1772 RepID=UPI001E3FB81A|nr:LysR family transcriptional regulator [Mycolicibacterium smegmatis]UGU33343.1 LysR family transcriptional regulator [Mycolicibacterium smegmatis]